MSEKRNRVFLLATIIAGAFLLRFVGMHWGQSYQSSGIGDDLEAYEVALNLVHGDEKAWYIGQPNLREAKTPGPLWALFWALPLKLGGGPETVSLLMISINTAAILLVYVLVRKMLDPAHAIWSAASLAFSPWPVYFSIGADNPNTMCVLGAVLYVALWDTLRRPRSPHVFWVCLVLAMMPQFHMVGIFLAPPVLLFLALRRREIHRKWLAAGCAAAVVIYLPYVVGECRHGWHNTRSFFLPDPRGGFSFGCIKALIAPVKCLTNYFDSPVNYDIPGGYLAFGDSAFGSIAVLVLFNLLSLLLALGAVFVFLAALRRILRGNWLAPRRVLEGAPVESFIAMLVLIPSLIFMLTGHAYNSRYAIVAFPLLFVLPAIFLRRAASSGRRARILAGGYVLTLAFGVVLILAFFHQLGGLIERGDHFLPSFRKMAGVHGVLKAAAGEGWGVRLESGYPASQDDDDARNIRLLVKYIDLLERFAPYEAGAAGIRRFRVDPSLEAPRPGSIYRRNGIEIVRSPERAQTVDREPQH